MSDVHILAVLFIIVATGASYYLGRRSGIQNAVDYLEEAGVLEFDDTNKK